LTLISSLKELDRSVSTASHYTVQVHAMVIAIKLPGLPLVRAGRVFTSCVTLSHRVVIVLVDLISTMLIV